MQRDSTGLDVRFPAQDNPPEYSIHWRIVLHGTPSVKSWSVWSDKTCNRRVFEEYKAALSFREELEGGDEGDAVDFTSFLILV